MEKENKYGFLLDEDRDNDLDQVDLSEFPIYSDELSGNDSDGDMAPAKKTVKVKEREIAKRVQIMMPSDMYMKATILSQMEGKTFTKFITDILASELERRREDLLAVVKMIRK